MSPEPTIPDQLQEVSERLGVAPRELALRLGASEYAVHRWLAGSGTPSPEMAARIGELAEYGRGTVAGAPVAFASNGVRKKQRPDSRTLFDPIIKLAAEALDGDPLEAISDGDFRLSVPVTSIGELLESNRDAVLVAEEPPSSGMSAGKNTYTYDAHSYHTKVPPQGIAELLRHYLPEGGLVLDPFSGSGMTGVAASVVGADAVLNELSPAASFISSQFCSRIDPQQFAAVVAAIVDESENLRRELYATKCRECGNKTEITYTVWAYRAECPECSHEFNIWDEARYYGSNVREHKILKEFPCPSCLTVVKKSGLKRTVAEPVEVTYRCCGPRNKLARHSLDDDDLALVKAIEADPPVADGYFPTTRIPDGVNLGQPKRHGLDSIDKFYTPRNLAASSWLWHTIHRVEDPFLRAAAVFAFTSLYTRTTRLSEFRFWGGSGNLARFNVPFVFKEANVFDTFARKARSIQDHLETTAAAYSGRILTHVGSATDLSFLPDGSIDLVFTDPPFGANINYSEVNILWESWLGQFTSDEKEVIVNRHQGKDAKAYGNLMHEAMREVRRVLRSDGWMLMVFMNSSAEIWAELREAIESAGFTIESADIFDKQHGTFKQFVDPNTAGADLVLHCRPTEYAKPRSKLESLTVDASSVEKWLLSKDLSAYIQSFLHVGREAELDYRRLYSEWMAESLVDGSATLGFPRFVEYCRAVAVTVGATE